MLLSQTVSLTIPRNWIDLYETIWKPDYFPKWATGLIQSSLVHEGAYWKANGPEGVVNIRFTDHNAFGVMDHFVDAGLGKEAYVPMRVVANQEGADVLITIFHQPLVSEEKFAQDVAWITRDLQTLYRLLTT